MKKGGNKGASTTSGRAFEDRLGVAELLSASGYLVTEVSKNISAVSLDGDVVGFLTKKRGFYDWLDFSGIERQQQPWEFEPDLVFANLKQNTIHILEMKTQSTKGSVDEKLFGVAYRVSYFRGFVEGTSWTSTFTYVLAGSEFLERREGKYRGLFKYIIESEGGYVFERDFGLETLGL